MQAWFNTYASSSAVNIGSFFPRGGRGMDILHDIHGPELAGLHDFLTKVSFDFHADAKPPEPGPPPSSEGT